MSTNPVTIITKDPCVGWLGDCPIWGNMHGCCLGANHQRNVKHRCDCGAEARSDDIRGSFGRTKYRTTRKSVRHWSRVVDYCDEESA